MNACIDCIKSYKNEVMNQRHSQAIVAPYQLRLLPLYISAMMKNVRNLTSHNMEFIFFE